MQKTNKKDKHSSLKITQKFLFFRDKKDFWDTTDPSPGDPDIDNIAGVQVIRNSSR